MLTPKEFSILRMNISQMYSIPYTLPSGINTQAVPANFIIDLLEKFTDFEPSFNPVAVSEFKTELAKT